MSLLDEIEKLMNVTNTSFNYRIINLGGKSLYIEGIKYVVSLSETEILLQLKSGILTICGTNMKVKYLDKSTCVVNGEISSVVVK